MEIENLTTIIDRVQTFYESAWLKLIVSFSALLGLIGIIVPIAVNWFQKKSFRIDEQNFENKLEKKIDTLKLLLINEIQEKMSKLDVTIDQQIASKFLDYEKKLNRATGGLFHLEGNINTTIPSLALKSYLTAIEYYLESDNESNLYTVLELAEAQLDLMFTSDFEIDLELEPSCLKILNRLTLENQSGKFTRRINFFKDKLNKAKLRIRNN